MRSDVSPRSLAPWSVALSLCGVSFALTYWIELRLFDLRVFEQWDVWFHTDPIRYWKAFTRPGWFQIRHPGLGFIAYHLVSTGDWAAKVFGFIEEWPGQLRVATALLVVPLASAVRSACVFGFFRTVTGRLLPAVLLTLIDICAFASISGGSVPESYP